VTPAHSALECRTASTTCGGGCAVTGSLQLIGAKTEFIWCAPPRRRHHVPNRDVQLGPDLVQPVQSERDLGVFMTMRTHINNALSSCTQADTNHQAISASARSQYRRTSLVHSCLDYCNVAFAGLPLPASDLQRMQSVLNAAVQLVTTRTHQSETAPHHCFVIVTGCRSSNASTTSCV